MALPASGLGQKTFSTSFCRTVTTGVPLTLKRTRNWKPRFSDGGTSTIVQLKCGLVVDVDARALAAAGTR